MENWRDSLKKQKGLLFNLKLNPLQNALFMFFQLIIEHSIILVYSITQNVNLGKFVYFIVLKNCNELYSSHLELLSLSIAVFIFTCSF